MGPALCPNFYEVLTLYRQDGINFLGVLQNAAAQIDTRYGRETVRIWKKAVAHTLYRGLFDSDTLKVTKHRSGKAPFMVHGFNVNSNQVDGSGGNLIEQARPMLQFDDILHATGGDTDILDAHDSGFFVFRTGHFYLDHRRKIFCETREFMRPYTT